MIPFNKIYWLHVEITDKCNAHCPSCRRNNNGYGLREDIVKLIDLPVERFIEVCQMLPNLKMIEMCGNHGDPIAGGTFDEINDYCLSKGYLIRINTNGSLKTEEWWAKLGKKFNQTKNKVIFGIDGLNKVHEIYRQGTSFNKIIANAKAFINEGGSAEWQFLMFKHNEHQAEAALEMSKDLGFSKFYIQNNVYAPKNGKARHYITNEEYIIEPVDIFFKDRSSDKKIVNPKNCAHITKRSLFVNVDGSLSTCCFLNNVPYEDNNLEILISEGKPFEGCVKSCGTFS